MQIRPIDVIHVEDCMDGSTSRHVVIDHDGDEVVLPWESAKALALGIMYLECDCNE